QYVLRGVDQQADVVGSFALALFAAVNGRPMPDLGGGGRRRPTRAKATPKRATKGGTRTGRKTPAVPRVSPAPGEPAEPGVAAAASGTAVASGSPPASTTVPRLGSGHFVPPGRPKPA
ncbi:MAG: hypothetical protein M3067_14275, partial [Chloroflexota bacterium]|nr:hypothetical protein [Chloroflexota bacterium]